MWQTNDPRQNAASALHRFQLVLKMTDRLAGIEIEDGVIRFPTIAGEVKYGGCRTQITDGLDVLHHAALDRFEADGDGDQGSHLAVDAIASEGDVIAKITMGPNQSARPARRTSLAEEVGFQPLTTDGKRFAGLFQSDTLAATVEQVTAGSRIRRRTTMLLSRSASRGSTFQNP